MLWRGLRRRCPRCGAAGLFHRWFHMAQRCPGCGYRFERQVGFALGAMTVNTIVTLGFLLATLVTGVAVTLPGVAVGPVVGACAAVAAVTPLVFFGSSRTVWAAIDLAMRPLEPPEEADAMTWLASRSP